jgi:hypothetical protein
MQRFHWDVHSRSSCDLNRTEATWSAAQLDPNVDPTVALAAMYALAVAYVLFRAQFVRELWIEPDDLDDRLATVVARLFGALRPGADGPAETRGRGRARADRGRVRAVVTTPRRTGSCSPATAAQHLAASVAWNNSTRWKARSR